MWYLTLVNYKLTGESTTSVVLKLEVQTDESKEVDNKYGFERIGEGLYNTNIVLKKIKKKKGVQRGQNENKKYILPLNN